MSPELIYFATDQRLILINSYFSNNNIASLLLSYIASKILNLVHLKCHKQMILRRLPASSISRVLKMYKQLNKISQFLLFFLHIHVSHQWSKISFHISITGISPNLNLAAANRTSLTWSTVPFSYHHSQKSYFSHLLLTLLLFYIQIIFCQHFLLLLLSSSCPSSSSISTITKWATHWLWYLNLYNLIVVQRFGIRR